MTRKIIKVPDMQYAGLYYPQIRKNVRLAGRINAPEITNEDPRDPFMQAESAFSLVGHYNSVLLDMVANSLYLRTCTIPESAKLLLELINYRLLPAGPGRIEILAELTSKYSGIVRLLESYRKFSTQRNADIPEIIFENPFSYDLTMRTDQIGYGYGLQKSLTNTNGVVSSITPDILSVATAPFTQAHLNQYISISNSTLGNDIEDLRIIEVFDQSGATYRKVRLSNASFISESGLTWTLRTITQNYASQLTAGTPDTQFITGNIKDGDKIYIGHPDVMWNRLDFTFDVSGTSGGWKGIWEYYDETLSTINPDSVSFGGGEITFGINSLVGTKDVTGALIEVTHIPSNDKFKAYSYYSSGNKVKTSYMGQPVPSTTITDYIISSTWKPITVIIDNTIVGGSELMQDGKLEFEFPHSQLNSWYKYKLYDITDGEEKLSYFIRYRIVDDAITDLSEFRSVSFTNAKHKILFAAIQGQTVEDSPIGSSSGEISQEFILTRTPYVLSSGRVFVDEGGGEYEWIVVTSLIRSTSTDRHCILEPQIDGTAKLKFGDGINGKIPPIGNNNIRVVYRIGCNQNGNVGANTVTVNRDGVGIFKNITNPQNGKYWIEADWSSQLALEKAKNRGAKLLQTMYRAVTPKDVETLAIAFRNLNGIRPVLRVKSYEETFGPKTIEVVVCGGNGAALTTDEINELSEYFNGGSTYGYNGVLLANHEAVIVNYSPKLIALQVTVQCYPNITEQLIIQTLSSLINPTALELEGKQYIWRFGQRVPLSKIESQIFAISPSNIFDVDITVPSSDIELSSRELPILDYVNTQVIITQPNF